MLSRFLSGVTGLARHNCCFLGLKQVAGSTGRTPLPTTCYVAPQASQNNFVCGSSSLSFAPCLRWHLCAMPCFLQGHRIGSVKSLAFHPYVLLLHVLLCWWHSFSKTGHHDRLRTFQTHRLPDWYLSLCSGRLMREFIGLCTSI